MNLLGNENDTIFSTGGQDSILIAYSDLRKVNSKLIELEYEKEINRNHNNIIINDSIAIHGLKQTISVIQQDNRKTVNKFKTQRNIAGGIGIVSIILLIISIL